MTYFIPLIPFPWESLYIDKVNDLGVPQRVSINMSGDKSQGFFKIYSTLEALKEDFPDAEWMKISDDL